ncbi:MAG: 3-hydroxyacyl-CoA dehydrogenase/enoyl-CoA hydratase family protein [Bryobacteraceae bacterium]|nr:3-hydroxyacyl-CoA dehydrogenase/enoyl-CoA hydratase family protein [Bryobacteraceae bacterium]
MSQLPVRAIQRVAVLGAGTMGSRIAAHFANAQVSVLLLDLTAAAAQRGLDAALKGKPAALYTAAGAPLISVGGFDTGLPGLANCDWILEAVTESLEIKRQLWPRVLEYAPAHAILSSNTSGIPLRAIAEGWPADARRRFLGTHFFNPPRYLHLLEVIPGPDTDPFLLQDVIRYGDQRLGKGVVLCKDTPNFIANRIGSFFGSTVYKHMVEGDYTIEEVDALTGSLIGLPNTATFRLCDLVGLDIWANVNGNLYHAVPDDPWRDRFQVPPFLQGMLDRGWLGDKSGQGFYQRVGPQREIQAIDWKTFEYHPAARPKLADAEAVKPVEDLAERLRALVASPGRGGTFVWKVLSDHLLYAAERVPEISDRLVEIDRAMRWGYANKLGPFELWDALGFETTARRLEREGRPLPDNVVRMLEAGAKSFYRAADASQRPRTEYFDFGTNHYATLDPPPGAISLAHTKRARGVVKRNAGASLIDLGDGVLAIEFHSKMNAIAEDALSMIYAGLEETKRNFAATVIANEGDNFSVGANLVMALAAAQDEEWDEIDLAIRRFQQATMAIKYAAKPVVAAPFGRALGGGCEIALHATRCQSAAELYIGLVEVGVGLIPGAGGCKELLLRLKDVRKVFETIGLAKVSTSAADAQQLGLLHKLDGISMNHDRLIDDAKSLALSLVPAYSPGSPRTDIQLSGEAGYSRLKLGLWSMRQGGYATDHDVVVGEKLARVLTGGPLTGAPVVSEQQMLDFEREAFLSLLGHRATQQRMAHMLKTGKPLRN